MANNEYVNKVQFGDQTVMDISDTTAEAGDVIQGQTFYTRSGAPATGTLGDATQSTHGLMSTTDKIKLDGIEEIDPYKTINTPAPLIHLTDAAEAPVKEIEIEINPTQDFNGYDRSWVGGTQKNLFPQANVGGTKRVEINNLNIPAGTYTFGAKVISADTDQDYCLILFYHDNTSVAYLHATRSSGGSRYTEAVTFSDTVTKIQFYASGGWDESEGDTFSFHNIQLEAGSTATAYEPYENICPISGWDTINIYDTKFNCYPEEWISDGYGLNDTGIKASTPNGSSLRTDFFPVAANTTYYYNFPALTGSSRNNIFWYDINKKFIRVNKGITSFQVTSPSNAAYAKLSTSAAYNNASGVYNNDICLNVYDETRNGEYEAYYGHEYEISLSQTVYGGKLTVYGDGSGELQVTHKGITIGDSSWYLNANSNENRQIWNLSNISDIKMPTNNDEQMYVISSLFNAASYINNSFYIIFPTTLNNKSLAICLPPNSYATEEDFKSALGDVQIVYELATPITYQLTLPQVQTLLSENNIWANSGNINKLIYGKNINGLINGADKVKLDRLVSGNPQYKYWQDDGTWNSPIAILEYEVSTWNDFISAYNANKAIYCKAPNLDNSSAKRIANLIYCTNDYAEFQFYRSDIKGNNDQMYVYALRQNSSWETTTRNINVSTMTGATSSANGTKGLVPAPTRSDVDKFLSGDGTYKSGGLPMVVLSYGSSTWTDFINAYNNNVIVYCRASSNSNPASGSQTRMAFMAYVNNATTPTNVEFQYYRSVSSHSATQMGDQVFIYKLDKNSGWSVTTREASIKEINVASGSKLGVSWNSNKVTLSNTMTAADMPMSSSDATTVDSAISTLSEHLVPNDIAFNLNTTGSNLFTVSNGSKRIGDLIVISVRLTVKSGVTLPSTETEIGNFTFSKALYGLITGSLISGATTSFCGGFQISNTTNGNTYIHLSSTSLSGNIFISGIGVSQ